MSSDGTLGDVGRSTIDPPRRERSSFIRMRSTSDRPSVFGVCACPQRIVWRRRGRRHRPCASWVAVGLDAAAEELATPSSSWAAAGISPTAHTIFWSWARRPASQWYGRLEEKPAW